jgi:hypothetical protein
MTISLPQLSTLLFLLLLLSSCGKSPPELKGIDLVRWKSDQNGCAGVRMQMTAALRSAKKDMLGLNEMEIVSLLGKPDQEELYKRNQKFYRYFIGSGPACAAPYEHPMKLIVRFNAVGLAKEISVE